MVIEEKVEEIAAGFRNRDPGEGRADHLEYQKGNKEPSLRSRKADQAVADVLTTDRGVAADEIGDENALYEAREKNEPKQVVTGPSPGPYHNNCFSGADRYRRDDRGGSEDSQKSENFLQRPTLVEKSVTLRDFNFIHESAFFDTSDFGWRGMFEYGKAEMAGRLYR